MGKIFFDANILIDIVEKRSSIDIDNFLDYKLYLSPLSFHILAYSFKYKIPSEKLNKYREYFTIIPFYEEILAKSLIGPTKDLEDNIQLHSAAEAECDYFLTNDKNLLNMKFFGKTQLVSTLIS